MFLKIPENCVCKVCFMCKIAIFVAPQKPSHLFCSENQCAMPGEGMFEAAHFDLISKFDLESGLMRSHVFPHMDFVCQSDL